MKKHYYLYAICALALILAIPVTTRAEDNTSVIPSMPPVPAGASASVREKLRADYEARVKNLKENQNYRNGMLEDRKDTLNTKVAPINQAAREKLLEKQREEMAKKKIASSTIMNRKLISSTTPQRKGEQNREYLKDGKAMRMQAFQDRKDKIVRELNTALNNLKDVRSRIQARIEKAETSGRDMTEAKRLLAIADTKITAAESSINSILSLVPNISTTTIATTTNIRDCENKDCETEDGIDLEKPRLIADGAIQAIKEAKKALNDTVIAIAHAMGFKVEGDKIVNATTTSTTTDR